MITNRENNVANETVTERVIKSVMFVLLLVVLTRLILNYGVNDSEKGDSGMKNQTETNQTIDNFTAIEASTTEKVRIRYVKQPSCPKSPMLVILKNICTDLMMKNEYCSPEDFFNKSKHKIPKIAKKNSATSEPKVPAIMNYVVGGLLITSLGAALVELYKAKKQVPKKNGKCPLSRKSSLADLTVMKHQRKELIRRESILEVPEECRPVNQLGRKVSRPPLRLD